jgi:hypothetical protein
VVPFTPIQKLGSASQVEFGRSNFLQLGLSAFESNIHIKNKAAYTKEGRRQLFALLQGARVSTGKFLLVWYLWKWKPWFYMTDSAFNQAIYAMLI